MVDGRAAGVQLRDRATGNVTAVRATHVVVAADSLRTPQLLFASGVRPRALGHYLNEHPQVSIMAEVDGLGSDRLHEGEIGNATAMSDSTAVAVAASGVTWIPYEGEKFPFHGMLAQIDPDTVPRSAEDRRARKPMISVHFFASQEVRFENWLEFSETETDWIGMPAMTIHHTLSDRDRETLEHGQAEALRLAMFSASPPTARRPGSSRRAAPFTTRDRPDGDHRRWPQRLRPGLPRMGHQNLYVAGTASYRRRRRATRP